MRRKFSGKKASRILLNQRIYDAGCGAAAEPEPFELDGAGSGSQRESNCVQPAARRMSWRDVTGRLPRKLRKRRRRRRSGIREMRRSSSL